MRSAAQRQDRSEYCCSPRLWSCVKEPLCGWHASSNVALFPPGSSCPVLLSLDPLGLPRLYKGSRQLNSAIALFGWLGEKNKTSWHSSVYESGRHCRRCPQSLEVDELAKFSSLPFCLRSGTVCFASTKLSAGWRAPGEIIQCLTHTVSFRFQFFGGWIQTHACDVIQRELSASIIPFQCQNCVCGANNILMIAAFL